MKIWNLDDGEDLGGVEFLDLENDEPIVTLVMPGPAGPSASGSLLLETLTTDTEIDVDNVTEYLVIWATEPIIINLPLASNRIDMINGRPFTIPLTIKNQTGVQVSFVPNEDDEIEITSENYQNQSVTLLPRTGGYSAI